MRLKSEEYAPSVTRIYSLTEFQRKAKEFLRLLRDTRVPLILTVNGKASVVVQDAPTYQEMVDRIKSDSLILDDLIKHRDDVERTRKVLDELSAER